MRSLCVCALVVAVLVLQSSRGDRVECVSSDSCTCQTNSDFNINLNGPGKALSRIDVHDIEKNSYTLSPCTPIVGCQQNNALKVYQGVIAACIWIKHNDTSLIIGESASFEWDVKSKYYFSVTFKTTESVPVPRQTKMNFIVDKNVTKPQAEFIGLDDVANTYNFNVRIKKFFSPA